MPKYVAVVGDVMVDEYVILEYLKNSPESMDAYANQQGDYVYAENTSRLLYPGGAANVARSLVSLGLDTSLYGVVGNDGWGLNLMEKLNGSGIRNHVEVRGNFRTTVKKRYMDGDCIKLRIDSEDSHRRCIEDLYCGMLTGSENAGFVISDYNKGVVTDSVVSNLTRIAKDAGIPVFANIKPTTCQERDKFYGVDHVIMNEHEWGTFSSFFLGSSTSDLMTRLDWKVLIITYGDEGLEVYADKGPKLIPAEIVKPKDVRSVIGAGDTVLAAYTSAILDGLDPYQAAEYAVRAAGIKVTKPYTSIVSFDEITKTTILPE